MADIQICRVDGCVNRSELDDLGFCGPHLEALCGWHGQVSVAVRTCTVEGCGSAPRSAYWPYCQKHDARIRRHGHVTQKPRDEVIFHSHGYRLVQAQGHPMAKGLRAYEHRKVYFDAHPEGPEICHWCDCELTWATLQVDHLNAVRDDNRIENLVAACGDCNRDRAKPAAVRAHRARAKGYMVNGKWLSIAEAARSLGIERSAIITRLKNGWSVERAMTEPRGRFGPKRAA
jgi:hypothetical protein